MPKSQKLTKKLIKSGSFEKKMISEQIICISKKEYEGMKETIELLQDPQILSQILESEQNIKAGKIKKFEY